MPMQPDVPRRYVSGPPRDEKLPIDVLRRVMPKADPVEVPLEPTLLDVIVDDFYVGTANEKPKVDGNGR